MGRVVRTYRLECYERNKLDVGYLGVGEGLFESV